jgi:hypothetical protein
MKKAQGLDGGNEIHLGGNGARHRIFVGVAALPTMPHRQALDAAHGFDRPISLLAREAAGKFFWRRASKEMPAAQRFSGP